MTPCPDAPHPDTPLAKAAAGQPTRRNDGTCHWCGSLDPDILMARLETGDVTLTPTDKNYKVYVRNEGGAPFLQTYSERLEDCCEHVASRWITRDVSEVKFYFGHFTAEQRTRFVELLNAKRIKLGYPGYFYKLPFFVVHDPEPPK